MKLIFSINILLFTNKIICLNSRITFHKYYAEFQQSKVKQMKFKPKKKKKECLIPKIVPTNFEYINEAVIAFVQFLE